MKNKLIVGLSALAIIVMSSCTSNDSDNSSQNNSNKKYIKSVTTIPAEDPSDAATLSVNYDAAGKVISATDGTETTFFAYEDGHLKNIGGSSDVLTMTEVTGTPQDGFEIGRVLQYDSNGNPVKVQIYERDWDDTILATYEGEIIYDNKPNPYYSTLEAAGIIEVLNNVNINFSLNPQSEQLVKAKMLLPANNPKKMVIKDLDGMVKSTIVTDYVYDNSNYPLTATTTTTDEDGGVYIYSTSYTYK